MLVSLNPGRLNVMNLRMLQAACLFAGLTIALPGYGQDSTQAYGPARYGISLQLSTTGIGLQLAREFRRYPRLTARLGASYFAYRKLVRVDVGEGSKLDLSPDIVLGIGQINLKWHPFRKSSFFVSGGGGYSVRPDVAVTIRAQDKLKFGGLEMTPENVGTIRTALRWGHPLGYGSLGFGRTIPRRRMGFGVELGCYYLGRPEVRLEYEGFLETTTLDEQVPKIEQNMRNYRWLPSLQFNLSYRL